MVKVITYGTYDLLHYGHIRLLERAKALGDYLIVGVTSDSFDLTRGKINAQQSLMERIEAVKAIRALNRSDAQLIPIIALSANAFEEDKMESAKAGMNAHLSKPIDVDILFRSIAQILNNY